MSVAKGLAGGLAALALCAVVTPARAQAPKFPSVGKPPQTPTVPFSAYTLKTTTLKLNCKSARNPVTGASELHSGTFMPAGPFSITWSTATGEPPPATVKVVFAIRFDGYDPKDYMVSDTVALKGDHYEIDTAAMSALAATLVQDLDAALARDFDLSSPLLNLQGAVKVSITPVYPAAPASNELVAWLAGQARTIADRKAVADKDVRDRDLLASTARARAAASEAAAKKSPTDPTLAAAAAADRADVIEKTNALATARQLADDLAIALRDANDQVSLARVAERPAASGPPLTPQTKPTTNALTIVVQPAL